MWMTFLAQIFVLIIALILIKSSVLELSQGVHEALNVVFGFTPRIVLGSMVTYIVSQSWDVWTFHKLKEKYKGKKLWIRNNVSTISSQLLDSAIFIGIAFYGIIPGT